MTTDLEVLKGPGAPVAISYASPARSLTGTAKAAQKFAFLFLREYDANRNRGTQFPILMANGGIRTDADVVVQFTAAVLRILRELGDQSELPPSEQISKATLVSHALFSDFLTITVRLTTGDGTTIFNLPLETI